MFYSWVPAAGDKVVGKLCSKTYKSYLGGPFIWIPKSILKFEIWYDFHLNLPISAQVLNH